jgi:anti-anti-sigma factor
MSPFSSSSRAEWGDQGDVLMNISLHRTPAGARVLVVQGECDISNAEQLRTALLEYVRTRAAPVVDLVGLTFCDARGMAALVDAAAVHPETRLTVYTHEGLARLLRLVKMDALLDLHVAADAVGTGERLEPPDLADARRPH